MSRARTIRWTVLALLGLVVGCTGSREGAAEQLRSALSSDRVPEQYEPDVPESDEFEPNFDE